MAGDTKERILETALVLFAQNGYLGTSMTEIAGQLGITKAALYKHYAGKQQLLEQIVARMNAMDEQRARAYAMPEPEPICRCRWKGSGHTARRSLTIGPGIPFPPISGGC